MNKKNEGVISLYLHLQNTALLFNNIFSILIVSTKEYIIMSEY